MRSTFTQLALVVMASLFVYAESSAQLISRFDFNSTATLTQAAVGPNGSSASPAAVSPGGIGYITSGCGAGIGMDLAVPGTVYDVDNISIRVRFRRAPGEMTGLFFQRDQLDFGFVNGRLYARWAVSQGGGSQNRHLLTNHLISDTEFRVYEFTYDNCTGQARLLDNGTEVGFLNLPNNNTIAWNSGDALIGAEIDNGCSQTGGIDWIVVGGNSTGCLILLPVELASFDARPLESAVHIDWATNAEVNNDYFTVERSWDGKVFEDLVDVPGAGNSNTYNSYSVDDTDMKPGQRFYRLRQTDHDGSSELFSVVEVLVGEQEIPFDIYPNPSGGELQVQLPGPGVVEVCDVTGKTLLRDVVEAVGSQTVLMSLGNLSKGLYLVRYHAGGQVHTKKLILQN